MPAPQELILSACASETTAASLAGRAASTPALHLHDLLSSTHVHSFKTSVSSANTVGYVVGKDGAGGAVMAVQEGKAIVHVWAWQKDQMHLKLHLPERLRCFSVSPNGCWAVGGSATGQVYLWELSSGLLLASFSAHYRDVVSLSFSQDSHLLLSASLDSAVHVYLVSRLVDDDDQGALRKPYGVLGDHTLGIRAVCLGRTAGSSGGRCWTASDDGTVKMWSLYPPFNLLCTFSFPPTVIPTTIVADPSERFIYVGSQSGDVYFIPLFKRRQGLGERDIEAVGGGEAGAPPIKADGAVISVGSPITCLALSLSATHLLIGTQKAETHIHSLPSHQHMRTIAAHAGPITHLSTLLRPPDLIGSTTQKQDAWPVMDIKPFERIRVGRAARDVQETTLLLRPREDIDSLRPARQAQLAGAGSGGPDANMSNQVSELMAENKRLRAGLERAAQINEKIWHGLVDMGLEQTKQSGGQ